MASGQLHVRAVNKCNSTRQVPIVDGVSGDSEIAGLMATKFIYSLA